MAAQQQNTNVSLFFDNETINFNPPNIHPQLLEKCNNIIPIKVSDTEPLKEDIPNIQNNVRAYFGQPNICEPGETVERYIELIANFWLFDNNSGISTQQLNTLNVMFSQEEFAKLINYVIFDFDRTFTMCEGLPQLNTINDFINHPATRRIPVSTPITAQDTVLLLLGGIKRRNALLQLLQTLLRKQIKILILTNNNLPISHKSLLPDILTIMGLRPEELELPKFEIISTHDPKFYITRSNGNVYRAKKYEILEKQRLCDIHDTTEHVAEQLKRNNFTLYNQWSALRKQSGGYKRKSKKSRKIRKSKKKI